MIQWWFGDYFSHIESFWIEQHVKSMSGNENDVETAHKSCNLTFTTFIYCAVLKTNWKKWIAIFLVGIENERASEMSNGAR